MGNLGNVLMKLTALAGGAVLGAILSRMYDEALTKRAEERSDRDKSRYAQGLSPVQGEQQR